MGDLLNFACPFYKFNPQKYSHCLRYRLHRIKDVKQHIHRQHMKPAFYCALCFTVFKTPEDRDRHARDMKCSRREKRQFDGISDRELKMLQRATRGEPADKQWFDIWNILFQQTGKPRSCYLGSYLEEVVSQLRVFWDTNRSDILMDNKLDGMTLCLADSLIKTTLDRFEFEGSDSDSDSTDKTQIPTEMASIRPLKRTEREADEYSAGSAKKPRLEPVNLPQADPLFNLGSGISFVHPPTGADELSRFFFGAEPRFPEGDNLGSTH
ncbi:hypothetical protein B0T10DRAFT_606618 [Thelonectria olida]|uniref:C2H2-type domain-containing protein n=1 Tax=Thelonectria olida TaxID=1576542 RepID=A0A9P8W6I7_9HYPO|nr:hypothetical protein B0T10DRAFT_606618 [Thelonectria olida]